MDGLNRMLDKAKQLNWLISFGIGSRAYVSHLLFADDTLVFCDAEKSQVQHLSITMMLFEVISELHINMFKIVLFIR